MTKTWKSQKHDPCHGLIAFNLKILKRLNLDNIKKDYFFEQDIILNIIELNGRIKQFKNEVFYGDESSKLNPVLSILPFLYYHLLNLRYHQILNFLRKD